MSQMAELDLGACFGEDRLDEPMTQEQFLQQMPARLPFANPIPNLTLLTNLLIILAQASRWLGKGPCRPCRN